MSTEILVGLILLLVFSTIALLLWMWKDRFGDRAKRNDAAPIAYADQSGGTDCPLCGERLPRGIRVHSAVYPGKEFDLMRIYGCRNCWSGEPSGAPNSGLRTRRCPYCGEEVPENGYVMAQVYRKPGRRTHVHVYGCTVCKPGRG